MPDVSESPTTAPIAHDAAAFIDRVVAWVQNRTDRDVILTELWSRLFIGPRTVGETDAPPATADSPLPPPPIAVPGPDGADELVEAVPVGA